MSGHYHRRVERTHESEVSSRSGGGPYGLTVYTARALSDGQLETIVGSIPGLSIRRRGGNGLPVLWGKGEIPAFTVAGPRPIDADEVPDVVVPHVVDPAEIRPIISFV